MGNVSIPEAIALFAHSKTARGAKGQVGTWPGRVVERLQFLNDIDEIGFVALKAKSKNVIREGEFEEGAAGVDLKVNPAFINSFPEKERLPAASLILVHEGTHAALDFHNQDQNLYEEMGARKLPIYYYRELSCPGVVNILTDKRVWLGHSNSFDEYRDMSRALDKDQMVDYVLSIPTYRARSYLDEDWVVNNFNNWGGIKNRWPGTRRLYVKKLLPVANDPHYAVRILGILESIQSKEEWDRMISAIKEIRRDRSLWTLQVSFEGLVGSRDLAGRMSMLEKRWGTVLTEQPGKP
jgi:hypothetical protein